MTAAPAEPAALPRTHGPGASRRLSDLIACHRSPGHPVFLTDSALHCAGAGDPVLYTAWRDVLAPRQAAGTDWFADLVVYQPGELPGGELHRSTGHWNSPAQLEVFQTVTGRTLMITAWRDDDGRPLLRYQECGPGDLAAVPFGAWHLTLVLDGPAAVFNLYCDLPGAAPAGTGPAAAARHAASREQDKYQSGPAVEITATRTGPKPRALNRLAKADAFCKTHSPMGTISPFSSANFMNLPGDTSPYSGLFHRINASRLYILPVARSIKG